MKSMFVIRGIMIALTATLAALLIARGDVVIGVVLGALALARVAMLVRMQQRREQFRRRAEARGFSRSRFQPPARTK